MNKEDDLSVQILELLESRKELRNSEIVKALCKKPSGLFKVKVTRTLTKLANDERVEKITRSHKNVAYVITEQGRNWIGTFYLNRMLASMPPVEFRVFQTLIYFLISHVYIMAPPKATVEDYRKMLVEQLNKADFSDKAKALMNDPRKVHARFSEYLKTYRDNRRSTLRKDSNVFDVSE
jgi:DNA-binding PadR family transcriptional regulator